MARVVLRFCTRPAFCIGNDGAPRAHFLQPSRFLLLLLLRCSDFKPENLLVVSLSPQADTVAKLADFGAARMLAGDAPARSLTAAVGTPIYMAPEVLRHEPYSAEADIFSYGVTIYTMFSQHGV